MAGKKPTAGRSANQPGRTTSLSGKPISSEEANRERSFRARLQENKPRLFLYQKICVFLVAFLVFANGISNDFNFDDGYYIAQENPIAAMGIKGIPKIFTGNTLYDNSHNSFEYRPIPLLTFALQHQFLGDAPATGHFINVFIYSVLCLLIFILLFRWFGSSYHWFAFLVTLVYAVHPLHTEVVDSIKSRDELLAALFCYMAALSAWKWGTTGEKKHLIICIILFSFSTFCKATILPYVVVIPLSLYFFTNTSVKKMILLFAALCIPYFFGYGLIGSLISISGNFKRVYSYIENPMVVMHIPFGIKTATASYIMGWYLYLHLVPHPLSFYYGYKYVQLLDWGNVWPVLSLAAHLLLGFWIIKNFRKRSIAVFGAMFYFICVFPFSNLVSPPAGMMAERFTFGSSLGYCILLVSGLYFVYKITPGISPGNKNSKYLLATFSLIFISYTAMTMVRNTQWKNHWTLFSHDIQHLQNSAMANVLYGEEVLIKTSNYREKYNKATGAEKLLYQDSLLQYLSEEKRPFLRALEIDPDYILALYDLAIAYSREDSFEQAKKYLLLLRSKTADLSEEFHYNLGWVYMNLALNENDTLFADSAKDEFDNALRINPAYVNAYWRLSQIHLSDKDTIAAFNTLLTGSQKNPDAPFLYMELAKFYERRSDTAQILYYYHKAADVSHPDQDLIIFLQNWYHNTGDFIKEDYYREKLNAMRHKANETD